MNDTLIDKYRIDDVLGEGGMGAVYAATNLWTHRRVAIKILRADFHNNPEAVQRFWLEAQATSRIENAHVLQILDMGHDEVRGIYYLVEELLLGEDLRKHLQRVGRMDTNAMRAVLEPVLDGLASAHRAGIVHRDIKPENIVLTPNELGGLTPKIIDFGIAKSLHTESVQTATRAGAIMGTPDYMSPEQARGDVVVDARTDVWAVGMIAYEMLSGRVAFPAATENLVLLRVMTESVEPLQTLAPEVSDDVARWVHRSLAIRREERFANASEMLAALRVLSMNGHPPSENRARTLMSGEMKTSRQPPSRSWGIALTAGVIASAAFGGWKWQQATSHTSRRLQPAVMTAPAIVSQSLDAGRESDSSVRVEDEGDRVLQVQTDAGIQDVLTIDTGLQRRDAGRPNELVTETHRSTSETAVPVGTRPRVVRTVRPITHETPYDLQ